MLVFVLLVGMVYVGMRWSPSSYGNLLTQIGMPGAGLAYGVPRPIRSDEWAVATPLLQATIRNGFGRFNETSVYNEDLRMNFGLPIADWGLLFKPSMWGYFVLPAATAYSLHWYLLLAAFIGGYTLLFKRMHFTTADAALIAAGLWFTGLVQFWWNEKGSEFALFPLVLVPLLIPGRWWLRLLAFYWLCTCWLLTNFYPPVQVSLAFVGAIVVLASGRDWLEPKRLAALAAAAAASGMTTVLYLRDYLIATSTTLYPGHRVAGGGAVAVKGWLTQFFPFLLFDWQYNDLTATNICEAGTVGLAFALMVVGFLRYGNLVRTLSAPSDDRWSLAVLTCGLAAMTGWLLVPFRPWVGVPFLWDNVQPVRMQFAAGLLFVMVVCTVARVGGLVVTRRRLLAYAVLVIVGWLGLKAVDRSNLLPMSNDVIVLPAVLLSLLFARRWLGTMGALLGASTLAGAIVLFGFNPLQSSAPIFTQSRTPILEELDLEAAGAGGTLAVSGFGGATLNGLGYRSVAHVTTVPALAYWHNRYPDMPAEEFDSIFNRYSHVGLQERDKPVVLSPDAIAVPLKDVQPPNTVILRNPEIPASNQAWWIAQGQRLGGRLVTPRSGSIDTISIEIGTGGNSASGLLKLELCDQARCAAAVRDVAKAVDNHAMAMKLDQQLPVRTGDVVDLRFSLDGSTAPVAFWTFTPADPRSATVTLDTGAGPRLLHMRLMFAENTSPPLVTHDADHP